MKIQLKNVKYIFSDFDGVMTDNRVLVGEDGKESVMVSRADGMGIKLIREKGIEIIIMSTETNPVVTARAKKLNISALQSIKDKGLVLKEYCETQNINLSDVMYVGNDINDLSAMEAAGYKVVPNDAYEQVKKIADIVLKTKGGYGVFRELAELIDEG